MSPRVALAVTARDEARLLPAHLAYHRLLGVERAYVYLDETGDATRRNVERLDFVTAGPCVPAARFAARPELERFVARYDSHLAARQSLNVVDAMERARADGFDWLLSIDADELVCLDRDEPVPGSLPRALQAVPDHCRAAQLPNLEVVQCVRSAGLPFRHARLFKSPGGPRLPVRDPRNGRLVARTWFFGHRAGKCLVRLGRGAVPGSSHHFATPEGRPLETHVVGEVLHYHAYDFEDWLRRCRNYHGHADRHVSGRAVEAQKLLWIDLVDALDRQALHDYFVRTLVPADALVALLTRRTWRRLFRRPCVVEVRSAARAFDEWPGLRRY